MEKQNPKSSRIQYNNNNNICSRFSFTRFVYVRAYVWMRSWRRREVFCAYIIIIIIKTCSRRDMCEFFGTPPPTSKCAPPLRSSPGNAFHRGPSFSRPPSVSGWLPSYVERNEDNYQNKKNKKPARTTRAGFIYKYTSTQPWRPETAVRARRVLSRSNALLRVSTHAYYY